MPGTEFGNFKRSSGQYPVENRYYGKKHPGRANTLGGNIVIHTGGYCTQGRSLPWCGGSGVAEGAY